MGRLLFGLLLPAMIAGNPAGAGGTTRKIAAASNSADNQARNITLAAGTLIYLRLETPLSTKASHLRAEVTSRVVREVPSPSGVVIPLRAVVRGTLEKLIPSSSPTARARMLVRFDRLEIPGQPAVPLVGHVVAVENARESVLPDGTIQGLLASEIPLASLEGAVAKRAESPTNPPAPMQKTLEKFLGKSDTSIDYPAGTDLVFALDQPLPAAGIFPSAVADQLSRETCAAVERLLAEAPQRSSSKDGKPGDPLNLVVIGNTEQIRQAFQEAGWGEAEKKSAKSIWETMRAVAREQGYGAAPMSQLYLYGRAEDLAFQKMLNTFMKRHHLRLWRSPAATSDGREIWLGAATHDIGLDVQPGVISHAIDPNLDDERAKVGADLVLSGRVAVEQLLTRPNPLFEGMTATGGTWKTDGRLMAIELKAP